MILFGKRTERMLFTLERFLVLNSFFYSSDFFFFVKGQKASPKSVNSGHLFFSKIQTVFYFLSKKLLNLSTNSVHLVQLRLDELVTKFSDFTYFNRNGDFLFLGGFYKKYLLGSNLLKNFVKRDGIVVVVEVFLLRFYEFYNLKIEKKKKINENLFL